MRRAGRATLFTAATVTCAIAAGTAIAGHAAIDTQGHTTLEQAIVGSDADGVPATDYQRLRAESVSGAYVVRDAGSDANPRLPQGQAGREARRASLAYFAQTTDFQFADEESPARVEFVDNEAESAHRPYEAFTPYATDATVRQINSFAPASPVPQGDGTANAMDFTLVTGDQADNMQHNETEWVREVLEGGRPLNFNSGVTDPGYYTSPSFDSSVGCAAFVAQEGGTAQAAAEGGRYTGVQDASDYPPTGATPGQYYDPDAPTGRFAEEGWPTHPGLLDQAQQIVVTPEGLDVPFYLANGNHDVLVQGNEDANQAFERIATSCEKVLASARNLQDAESLSDLLASASNVMLVPPDPKRRFVSKAQLKEIYGATIAGDDDHGFAYVDPKELQASRNSASYYAWDPAQTPGFRFISIDTNSEGGVLGPFSASPGPLKTGSSNGNIDDPQFRWLKAELDAAQAAGKLIVVFGHHPIRSMNSVIPDEAASPCTGNDPHGHDVNPGCDLDPRSSNPVHLGDPEAAKQFGSRAQTVSELFANYPNLVTYVPGHTHENRVIAYPKEPGGAYWEVNTSAVIDHPQESRLMEIFDNRDGTLSIFGTILSHASPSTPPPDGTPGSEFDGPELASIGRELAYNDPQIGQAATAERENPPTGSPRDRNVELLLRDVRIAPLPSPGEPTPRALRCGGRDATIIGTTGRDKLAGTDDNDVIVGGPGKDKIRGGGGKDLICGGEGKDSLKGGGKRDVIKGAKGADKLRGQGGNDRATGGSGDDDVDGDAGRDKVSGGKDDDRLDGGPGVDRIAGGAGKDRCRAERKDRVGRGGATAKGCERIRGSGRPRR